jgi:hypothetical protein
MFLWGAQYVGGSVAGSYTPTTTTQSVASNIVTEAAGAALAAASLLGYVAENQATNLCLQSQDFSNASWVKTTVTVTADSTAAPDGSVTADTLAATGAIATASQTITVSAVPYAFSVYLKRLAGSGSVALVLDGVVTDVTAQINSSTWSRVVATGTPAAGAKVFSIRISTSGDSVYAWGAQVEAASDASSYVPTTAAAVTRNNDDLRYQKAGNFGEAVGTTYAESYLPVAAVGAYQTVLVETAANYGVQRYVNTKVLQNWSPGGQPGTVNTRTVGAVNKSAAAWSGATVSICLNGGAIAAAGFAPYSAAAGIEVGTTGGVDSIQGSIRNVRFYATRLADAVLQSMTA